jgi:hypothetical protein
VIEKTTHRYAISRYQAGDQRGCEGTGWEYQSQKRRARSERDAPGGKTSGVGIAAADAAGAAVLVGAAAAAAAGTAAASATAASATASAVDADAAAGAAVAVAGATAAAAAVESGRTDTEVRLASEAGDDATSAERRACRKKGFADAAAERREEILSSETGAHADTVNNVADVMGAMGTAAVWVAAVRPARDSAFSGWSAERENARVPQVSARRLNIVGEYFTRGTARQSCGVRGRRVGLETRFEANAGKKGWDKACGKDKIEHGYYVNSGQIKYAYVHRSTMLLRRDASRRLVLARHHWSTSGQTTVRRPSSPCLRNGAPHSKGNYYKNRFVV